jgi:hypothetical protein
MQVENGSYSILDGLIQGGILGRFGLEIIDEGSRRARRLLEKCGEHGLMMSGIWFHFGKNINI